MECWTKKWRLICTRIRLLFTFKSNMYYECIDTDVLHIVLFLYSLLYCVMGLIEWIKIEMNIEHTLHTHTHKTSCTPKLNAKRLIAQKIELSRWHFFERLLINFMIPSNISSINSVVNFAHTVVVRKKIVRLRSQWSVFRFG